ncbi:hypothetical protein NOG11_13590 [Parvularcula sp. BGMRC 0090]|uniref:Uncharacterized protein n=2 Tax=Parvularcula maris TaxID=2965077 RepID=A0A9X2LD83_9PROT|nr:hypothetical protein [Parvularcula maris]
MSVWLVSEGHPAGAIEPYLKLASEQYGKKLRQIDAEYAHQGLYQSGARATALASAASEVLGEFSEYVSNDLSKPEAEFSSYRAAHFDVLLEAIESLLLDMKQQAERAYVSKQGSDRDQYVWKRALEEAWNREVFDAQKQVYRERIRAASTVIARKKSFLYWAFSTTQKRLWTMAITSGAVLSWGFLKSFSV